MTGVHAGKVRIADLESILVSDGRVIHSPLLHPPLFIANPGQSLPVGIYEVSLAAESCHLCSAASNKVRVAPGVDLDALLLMLKGALL